jgi:hypothetical protein
MYLTLQHTVLMGTVILIYIKNLKFAKFHTVLDWQKISIIFLDFMEFFFKYGILNRFWCTRI